MSEPSLSFGLNVPNYRALGHRDAMTAIAERAEEPGYASLWATEPLADDLDDFDDRITWFISEVGTRAI